MADASAIEKVPAALRRFVPARFRSDIPIVPVVRLSGAIGISSPLKPGLTLASVARSLERAFAMRNARAVALSINSPGGGSGGTAPHPGARRREEDSGARIRR